MAQPLETIEIETGGAPSAAVIWLHGLGADGHDFEPVVQSSPCRSASPSGLSFRTRRSGR
jgi:predicted esterase